MISFFLFPKSEYVEGLLKEPALRAEVGRPVGGVVGDIVAAGCPKRAATIDAAGSSVAEVFVDGNHAENLADLRCKQA